MPYADPEVKRQKEKEYKSRPEVLERNRELYRKRYVENSNGLADKVKERHHSKWQDPEYREYKRRKYYERWQKNWAAQKIIQLQARAKKSCIEFSIDESDIVLPEFCPIFGIKLQQGVGKQSNCSPSVDRIDPAKGYVKGNVVVVSNRANSIKREATIEELKKIVAFYENLNEDQDG